MPFYLFVWHDENEQHLTENGITPAEFEEVVSNPSILDRSRTTGCPIAFGYTASGKFLACVYETLDEATVMAITAYEIDGP